MSSAWVRARSLLATRGPLACTSIAALTGATLGWRSAYAGGLGWTVPVAAVLGALIGLGVAVVRRSRGMLGLAAASLAGLVAYLDLVVNGSLDPHLLLAGLEHGPIQLISVSLPLAGGGNLLDAPVAFAWIAGSVVGVFASTRPPIRVGIVLVVGLAEVAALAIGVASSIGGLVTVPTLIGALLLATPREAQRPDRSDERVAALRRLRVGVEMLVVATLVGASVLAVPRIGRAQPVSLRRPPRSLALTVDDPIATVVALGSKAHDAAPWFRLHLDAPAPRYVSYLVLGEYDGIDWQLADPRFAPAGEFVPHTTPGIRTITSSVAPLRQGLGPWMPTIGEPAAVVGAPMAYDLVDEMAVVNDTALPRRGWIQRDVLGASPQTVLAPRATPPTAEATIPPGESQDLGHVLRVLQRSFSLPSSAPFAEVDALARDLRHRDRLVPLRDSSSKIDQADTLFADATHAVVVARRATTVQYATVVALVARELGLAARLVVGFHLQGQGSDAPPGTYLLGPSNLAAWVEVATTPTTWRIIDPNPLRTGAPTVARFSAAAPTHHRHAPTTTVTPGSSGHAIAPPVRLRLPTTHRPLPGVVTALAIAGVIVLLAGLAPLANQRRLTRRGRRRVRRAPNARHAKTRAWHEALALIERLGFAFPPGWTGSEIVEWLQRSPGAKVAALVDELRRDAERVLFDPAFEPPSSEHASAQFDQLDRVLTRRTGLGARWRAGLPRALRRRLVVQGAATNSSTATADRVSAGVGAR